MSKLTPKQQSFVDNGLIYIAKENVRRWVTPEQFANSFRGEGFKKVNLDETPETDNGKKEEVVEMSATELMEAFEKDPTKITVANLKLLAEYEGIEIPDGKKEDIIKAIEEALE